MKCSEEISNKLPNIVASLKCCRVNSGEDITEKSIRKSTVLLTDLKVNTKIKFINNVTAIIKDRKKKYTCYVCMSKFFRESDLNTHKSVHDEESDAESGSGKGEQDSDYSVNDCDESEDENDDLIEARLDTQPLSSESRNCTVTVIFLCKPCKLVLKTINDLRIHMSITGDCIFFCRLCLKTFTSTDGFFIHVIYHKNIFLEFYKCKVCNECLKDYLEFRRHEIVSHNMQPWDENHFSSRTTKDSPSEGKIEPQVIPKVESPDEDLSAQVGNSIRFGCELCFDLCMSDVEFEAHMDFHNVLIMKGSENLVASTTNKTHNPPVNSVPNTTPKIVRATIKTEQPQTEVAEGGEKNKSIADSDKGQVGTVFVKNWLSLQEQSVTKPINPSKICNISTTDSSDSSKNVLNSGARILRCVSPQRNLKNTDIRHIHPSALSKNKVIVQRDLYQSSSVQNSVSVLTENGPRPINDYLSSAAQESTGSLLRESTYLVKETTNVSTNTIKTAGSTASEGGKKMSNAVTNYVPIAPKTLEMRTNQTLMPFATKKNLAISNVAAAPASNYYVRAPLDNVNNATTTVTPTSYNSLTVPKVSSNTMIKTAGSKASEVGIKMSNAIANYVPIAPKKSEICTNKKSKTLMPFAKEKKQLTVAPVSNYRLRPRRLPCPLDKVNNATTAAPTVNNGLTVPNVVAAAPTSKSYIGVSINKQSNSETSVVPSATNRGVPIPNVMTAPPTSNSYMHVPLDKQNNAISNVTNSWCTPQNNNLIYVINPVNNLTTTSSVQSEPQMTYMQDSPNFAYFFVRPNPAENVDNVSFMPQTPKPQSQQFVAPFVQNSFSLPDSNNFVYSVPAVDQSNMITQTSNPQLPGDVTMPVLPSGNNLYFLTNQSGGSVQGSLQSTGMINTMPTQNSFPTNVSQNGTLYQDQLYSNFNLDSLNTSNLHMQCKYLMDMVDCQKQTVPDNILENSVVDQLNESDAELLNLLTAEEDCTAILNNIATNEQFQKLISDEADFVQAAEMEQFINKTCELPQPSKRSEDMAAKEGFRCHQCERICSTKKLLKKHLLIHTQERTFPCEVCGKLFRHRYEVTAHQKSHNKPTFQCDICSRMFIHKSHLNVHRKKHLGEYTAFCDECQIGFVTLTSFKSHRNTYHDDLPLICDSCGAKLSSLSSLKEHKLTHDPNYGKERSHVCEICGKSYLTSRNLRSHMKIHSKVCPYKCGICGKSVSSKSILETHLKMHTGVKDFNCEICDKNFASKEYLKVHQRTHNGDKPFECTICGKRFTQKTSLTVHIRYHTGQKPYKCECGKEFTTKSHLMTHYKTHDIGGVDIEYISHPLPTNLNM